MTADQDAAIATGNLPASVREMIGLIGLAPALALINAFAGQVICIPASDQPGGRMRQRLVAIVGDAAARALIANYPGQRLPIPRCAAAMRDDRDRRIIAAYDAGATVARLTAEYFLTDRQIRSILKRQPGQALRGLDPAGVRQLGLFDG